MNCRQVSVIIRKMNTFCQLFFISFFISNLFYFGVKAEELNVRTNNKDQHNSQSIQYSKNKHTCIKNQEFVWCIPLDYDDGKEPWRYRHITNTSFPWNYHFKFHIFDVKQVNDKTQTLGISMYFIITWLEPRLKINQMAPEWNDTTFGSQGAVDISPDVLNYLWNPDLEIYGMEEFNFKSILKDMSGIQIDKNRYIRYNARVDVTTSCQMSFDRYPLDTQQCLFRVGSYYSTQDTVTCTDEYEFNEERQRSLQYLIEMGTLPEKYRTAIYHLKRYAVCGVKISLNRTRMQTFFQVYLTSILFVAVSWVSFIIKPDVVPGRMGLLVTIFLVLINIFTGVKSNAPVSLSLNAIDLYLVICIGLVFSALVEYAIVLFKERCKVEQPFPHEVATRQNSSSNRTKNIEKTQAWPEKRSNMNRLDAISLFAFPIFFVIFNIIYCIIYI